MWTNDPLADWNAYSDKQERLLAQLPKCDSCGDAMDEYAYVINDEVLCESCMKEFYRKEVVIDED